MLWPRRKETMDDGHPAKQQKTTHSLESEEPPVKEEDDILSLSDDNKFLMS